jgi:hypothetical protein
MICVIVRIAGNREPRTTSVVAIASSHLKRPPLRAVVGHLIRSFARPAETAQCGQGGKD